MKLDWQLMLATGIVLLLGLLIHFSVSPQEINLHLIYVLFGVVLASLISRVHAKWFQAFYLHIYIVTIAILVATITLGVTSRGSTRWISLGPVQFQTSELTKLALICALPQLVHQFSVRDLSKLIKLSVVALVPFVLVFIQPDLGSAIILACITAAIIFAAGIRYRHLMVLGIIGLLLLPLLWLNLRPYQKDRIHVFLDPTADPLGKGYNTIQSLIAVGSGQLIGRGLGHGTQSKLKFLPEHHTDFVFASLAEELGLLGSLMLLLAYVWMIWRLHILASKASDQYTYLAIVGIITLFSSQILINIGMNIGLLPITGITLPLVSSGGSSIVVCLIAIGLAMRFSHTHRSLSGIEITARGQ